MMKKVCLLLRHSHTMTLKILLRCRSSNGVHRTEYHHLDKRKQVAYWRYHYCYGHLSIPPVHALHHHFRAQAIIYWAIATHQSRIYSLQLRQPKK